MRLIQKKAWIFFLCLFSFLVNSFSQEIKSEYPKLEDIIDSRYLSELRANNKISRFFTEKDNSDFQFYPDLELSKSATKKWKSTRQDNPNFTIESIYRLEKSKSDKEFTGENLEKILFEDAKIKKILRSVSKMEGIEYYSNSRKKTEVLYSKAYTVNNPIERKKIADNYNYSENPIYVLLDDNSFGEYLSVINNDSKNFENCFEYINIDNINYGIIKAVEPNNMLVFIDVINCENEIIVYVYIQSKMDVPAIFKNKIYDSFVARTDALFEWFKKSWRN